MNLSRLISSVCVILIMFVVACSDDDSLISSKKITGSGNLISETRTVADFSELVFTTVGSVTIERGSTQSVRVTVDDNIMSYISTHVSNGTLLIAADNQISEFDLTVEIVVPHVEGLNLTGVGTIVCQDQFDEDAVDIVLSGVGDIHLDATADLITTRLSGVGNVILEGSTVRNQVTHSGVGNLIAFDLASDTAHLNVSGVGNLSVDVSDRLSVIISSPSTVFYKGTPDIISTITGNGQLIDAN